MVRIFIVEDHFLVQQQYEALIDREADLSVCGNAETTEDALVQIAQLEPDLVIVDVSLKDRDGIALTADLRSLYADLPILIISGHEAATYAKKARQAGANGYLIKGQAGRIIESIRQILSGEEYFN